MVVLSVANKKKKRVLVASTSEVYGLSTDVPFREDGNLVMGATTKGRWSYACSKAIDEFLALNEQSQHVEYTVSWIDVNSTGRNFARGIFMQGHHSSVPAPRYLISRVPLYARSQSVCRCFAERPGAGDSSKSF